MRPSLAIMAMALAGLLSGLPESAQAQDKLPCDQFAKNRNGSWVALEDVDVPGLGRKLAIRRGSVLRPGAAILGIDLAEMLDRACPAEAAASTQPPPPPAVPLPSLADAGGNINIRTLTCGQLISTSQQDAESLLFWTSGWYNGASKKGVINVPLVRQGIQQVMVYCKTYREERVTKAIEVVSRQR